jgi:hypothetical protein
MQKTGQLRRYSDSLRAGWPGFRFPSGEIQFSLLYSVQIHPGTHQDFYAMNTETPSPTVEGPGGEADHSHLSGVMVKSGGATPPLPRMSLWHRA